MPIRSKTMLAAAMLAALPLAAHAQQAASAPPKGAPHFRLDTIATPPQPGAFPIWRPGTMPGAETPPNPVPESWAMLVGDVGATHIEQRIVRNVSVPTLTPVLPDPAKATGAAVIVAPGGGFLSLSIDPEGLAVAHWLADHGIAAFVLQYRLKPTPADPAGYMAETAKNMATLVKADHVDTDRWPPAVADEEQAVRLVRADAARWHVDPARVGLMGFSAGAEAAQQVALTATGEAMPAFVGLIYGPMQTVDVPANAPPLFSAVALDDPLFGDKGFGLVRSWQQAGKPVEFHGYARGDHGFGTGRPGTTTVLMLPEFRLWLKTQGFLGDAG